MSYLYRHSFENAEQAERSRHTVKVRKKISDVKMR